jgi:hypothetical protein
MKFKRSCGEPELLPYVEEAISIVENQLIQMDGKEDVSEDKYVSIQKQNEDK